MQIGWIDFSKKDRDKVFAVLDALTEPGAVDELGIGAIRDGFADIFFPGTSTVQTRAKYLVLIPYIMKNAMKGAYGTDAESILDGIDKEEKNCAVKMIQGGGREESILGWRTINAGRWLVRTPSLIYWSGLKALEIINDVKSIKSYAHFIADSLKKKDNKQLLKRKETEDDDGDDIDATTNAYLRLFAEGLPYTGDWLEKLDINLSPVEAAFLEQRILRAKPRSLLAYLVKKNNGAYGAETFSALYEVLKDKEDLSEEMKETMSLAVEFNRFMRIGFAAFNLALESGGVDYANEIIDEARPNFAEIATIDLDKIFGLLHIGDFALKSFLRTVRDRISEGDIEGLKECVVARERKLKGTRAKINKAGSFDKWVGLDILDYRLKRNASRILEDIKEGKNVQTEG
jgi:hypothetical protein